MQKKQIRLWTSDFIGIVIINVLIFIGNQLQLSTLPVYLHELSGGANSIIGINTALGTIAALIVRPFAGIAVDRLGRKMVLLTGISFLVCALMLYTIFKPVAAVLAVRFLFGLGWGISTTASNTLATDVIPKERFGEGMGYFSLSQSLSLALAPVIGLFLLESIQFRGLAFVSIGLMSLAIATTFFVNSSAPKIKKTKSKFAPYEKSAVRPAIIMVFVGAGVGSVFGFAILYGKNMGFENPGLFFTCYAIALFVTRPAIGKIIDKHGFNAVMVPGFIGFIISMLFLYFCNSQIGFLAVALIQGISYGAVQTTIQTMAVVNSPKNRRGAANATYFTGFDVGIGLGGLLAGIISSYVGYGSMFAFMSIPLFIGLILYHFIGRNIKKVDDSTIEEIIEETAEDMTIIDV